MQAQVLVVVNGKLVAANTLTAERFDQLVFGTDRFTKTEYFSADNIRGWMESNLESELEQLAHVCSLTELQQKKLQLAGKRDIVRFFDGVRALRNKYVSTELDQQAWLQALNTLQGIQYSKQDVIARETSYFQKTLRNMLNDKQLLQWHDLLRKRQSKIVNDTLNNVVGTPQDPEKMEKIIELVIKKCVIPTVPGPLNQDIVLMETDQIQDQLRPLFTDSEWFAMKNRIRSARGTIYALSAARAAWPWESEVGKNP